MPDDLLTTVKKALASELWPWDSLIVKAWVERLVARCQQAEADVAEHLRQWSVTRQRLADMEAKRNALFEEATAAKRDLAAPRHRESEADMKPVKVWAVTSPRALVSWADRRLGFLQMPVFPTLKDARFWVLEHADKGSFGIVRVEIREVPMKARREP